MYTWWCRAICSDWICHAALEAEKLSMTILSPSPNILLHPQYNQQIPLLQYHHPPSIQQPIQGSRAWPLYLPTMQTNCGCLEVWGKRGMVQSGETWFCEEILARGYCNSKCWHRNVIPLFYPFHSAVETQFHKVRQWTMLLRPIMKHALFFFFPAPPCDMNGFGNGTMQCGCIVHTHTIYIIQWESWLLSGGEVNNNDYKL